MPYGSLCMVRLARQTFRHPQLLFSGFAFPPQDSSFPQHVSAHPKISKSHMAAPGFGFSAGDFISAVKLISDVSKALKDTGGASENYLQILAELDLLNGVLTQLQLQESDASSQHNSNPFTSYARQQADLTLSTLAEFLNHISKFDAKLGPQRPSAWYRGVSRKAQWALFYAKQVDELRLQIGTQLHTLSILTQLQDRCVKLPSNSGYWDGS